MTKTGLAKVGFSPPPPHSPAPAPSPPPGAAPDTGEGQLSSTFRGRGDQLLGRRGFKSDGVDKRFVSFGVLACFSFEPNQSTALLLLASSSISVQHNFYDRPEFFGYVPLTSLALKSMNTSFIGTQLSAQLPISVLVVLLTTQLLPILTDFSLLHECELVLIFPSFTFNLSFTNLSPALSMDPSNFCIEPGDLLRDADRVFHWFIVLALLSGSTPLQRTARSVVSDPRSFL